MAACSLEKSQYLVRDGKMEDMAIIINLIKELTNFEQVPLSEVTITVEDLIQDGFKTKHPFFFTIILEDTKNQQIVGYTLCNYSYSSWTGRAMYIEDIYIIPELRGKQLGHRLLKALCQKARDEKVSRIDWHVLKTNINAQKFYRSHGAYDLVEKENRTAFRMDGPEIFKLANCKD